MRNKSILEKPVGGTTADVADAIAKKHTRQHAITSTADHTGTAGDSGYMMKADASGLPVKATNTDTDVASAVTLKHAIQHSITSTADHTSTATSGQVLKADGNGLPVNIGTQTANLAFMGPVSGAAANPTFRSPQAKDVTIPDGVGTPTYDDLQDFLNMTQASGRLTGGVITASATVGAIDISAMEMMVHTSGTLGSPLIYFKKAAVADLVLTVDPGVSFIWATYTSAGGGTITYTSNAARPTTDYSVFVIGRCYRNGSTVEVLTTGQNIYNQYGRMQDRMLTKYGSMDHATGAIISAHATPLQLACTGSKWYFGNTLIDLSLSAPNTFEIWYRHAGGVWTLTASKTLFSEEVVGGHLLYETYQTTAGDLVALSGNHYGVYWIFLCPMGDMYVLMGNATYANVGAAQASTVPTDFPEYCKNWAKLIGRVICQNSGAAFYSVESSFSTQFTLSATTDHSSLANLSADDHTQYLLVTGARALTGDLDFNALYQCHDLQAPAANGEAIRATAKITEVLLESATDLKHAAITLDANADTLLSLSTQALGLDTQTANYGFFGPTTGDATVPAFRAMVAADLPATYMTHPQVMARSLFR